MARFKVKGIKAGTRVGATGDIIHVNPEGSDERARTPIVDERDIAVLLEQPPLIEDPGDLSKLKAALSDEAARYLDVSRVDELAARDVAAISKLDDERERIPSGLGHREAVHYDPNQRVGAPASGIQAHDPDAPPVDGSLRTDQAVEANRTAAGTSVQDATLVAGGKPTVSASQEDGTIQVAGTQTRGPGRPRKTETGAGGGDTGGAFDAKAFVGRNADQISDAEIQALSADQLKEARAAEEADRKRSTVLERFDKVAQGASS